MWMSMTQGVRNEDVSHNDYKCAHSLLLHFFHLLSEHCLGLSTSQSSHLWTNRHRCFCGAIDKFLGLYNLTCQTRWRDVSACLSGHVARTTAHFDCESWNMVNILHTLGLHQQRLSDKERCCLKHHLGALNKWISKPRSVKCAPCFYVYFMFYPLSTQHLPFLLFWMCVHAHICI